MMCSIPDVPENRFPRRIEPLLCPRLLSLVNFLVRARCREPSRVCNKISLDVDRTLAFNKSYIRQRRQHKRNV